MNTANPFRIAVIPGDGIGPEVMEQTLRCLTQLRDDMELPLQWEQLDWPSTAYHQQHGRMMPDDAMERFSAYDAILLGALGDPGPLSNPDRYVLSDSESLSPLLKIRKGFDQWVCERPARLLPGATQYLADERAQKVDMLVIRENSEGEYVAQGGRLRAGTAHEIATQVEVFSRHATERVIRYAFDQARQRARQREEDKRTRRFENADGTTQVSQVCLITKRNALRYWGDMYTEVFAQVAGDYPDVATHHELIDAACMKFVQCPWRFDVVVASNLQGDILTDLAAVLSGGMGVAPSCNLNPDDDSVPSMFEPTHGSAPDIAGQGLADPTAMLFTAARMLSWLGQRRPGLATAGQRLFDATAGDLAEYGAQRRKTTEVGNSVLRRLRS
ncbi:isocitrate/isopropylmalate dehydrogenase family protein [Mangrovitalea sediminis]|uniref:isocitrate/isopropylmalate dehydrogenase family protein n=1 Tax=Mangrovitalea sediminis TaxID=1982043 RepID=UPI000BE5BFED|nr:isocitrate/isopropylmalate dehydrogenase family protein [Mangrovitalea sediminis]